MSVNEKEVSKDCLLVGEIVKTPLTIFANRPSESSNRMPNSSIKCQNVTIRKKKRKKDSREKNLDEDAKELLLEVGYIPVSDRIRLVEEGVNNVTGNNGALRAQNPILEVSK